MEALRIWTVRSLGKRWDGDGDGMGNITYSRAHSRLVAIGLSEWLNSGSIQARLFASFHTTNTCVDH